jgi:hypothetical protein
MTRGLDPQNPATEVTALKKEHRRGATVKITDYPLLGVMRRILNGDDTFPNVIKYASGVVPAAADDLTDKGYVDGVAVAGAPDSSDTVKGIVEQATQAEIETGAAAGGTTAPLFIPPSRNGARLYYGYAADAGSTDAYAITLSPVPTAYTTGMVIVFKANTVNTGAATINVNALGAKDIRRNNGLVLADGDIQAGQFVTLVYNGTYFEMQSPIGRPQISQNGSEVYAADSVGTDAYAITLSPAPTAYVTGQVFRFKAGTANTGAATLNVNSLGAKTIVKNFNATLANNDILANQIVEVVYDGTNLQLLSPISNTFSQTGFGGWTTATADGAGYQVTTDGFLVGYAPSVGGSPTLDIYSDSNATPTTKRAQFAGVTGGISFCVPVKKNDYYKIVVVTYSLTVFLIPHGT